MPDKRIEALVKRYNDLVDKNSGWISYYQDISDFCLPRKGWQTTIRNDGDRLKLNTLFDATAILSLQDMAAGFHSNLTNPSSQWFTYRVRNNDLMKIRAVEMWFKEVTERTYAVLNASNFDTTMQEFYVNAGGFGTGVILTLEDPSDKVRFMEILPKDIQIEEDSSGRVNRVYIKMPMTIQQAYDRWGKNAGDIVTEKIDTKPNDKLDICLYIGPRDRRDASKEDSVNMPYESLWIELTKKHVCQEGGFFEFPVAVGRFYKHTGDTFGFSPAMNVLSFIKLVNAQQKTMLRAAMKVADPPLLLPSRGFIVPLNLNPAALNYRDQKTTAEDLTQIPGGGNIPITLEVIQQVQERIEKGFFLPLFRALSDITKQMTVPEVQRRIAENMGLLGPVIGRFIDETLDVVLERVFMVLYRNGEYPDIPGVLLDNESDLSVTYTSPLAKAQRESEVFSLQSFLSDVGLIAQVKPDVLDNIDGDVVVETLAKVRSITPEILRDKEEVKAMREQRAQQQDIMNRIAMAQQGANAVKTGAEIDALSAKEEGK